MYFLNSKPYIKVAEQGTLENLNVLLDVQGPREVFLSQIHISPLPHTSFRKVNNNNQQASHKYDTSCLIKNIAKDLNY